MGIFNIFSKKPAKPYQNDGLNHVYELLFCDDIALYRQTTEPTAYPWTVLLAAAPSTAQLQAVATDKTLEARQRLLAYRLLTASGAPIDHREILGVVVEVGLPGGLDVLAAFSEGGARYLNQAEKLLVWETQTPESRRLIDELFDASLTVVNQIGKWEQPRRPFPPNGMVRLTFLVSDGLYFGEGPFEVLQADPMGGPVIAVATRLMAYLTQQ
ncbi:hypothetical protein GCM10027422_42520 [Hymenobacter arcticus]